MKIDNQYVCIQWQTKRPWVKIDTLSYTMRDSKAKLIAGGKMTWNELKKYGWKCIKVQIDITII